MKYLDAVEKGFLITAMLFTTGLLFTNVVLRYFFQSSIFWAEEMLRYLIVWITFIGASACVKEESHISIDVLSNALSPAGQRGLKIFLNLAGLVFGVIFLYISTSLIVKVKGTGQVSATIGNTPMYIIYLCFPLGFTLYAARSVQMLVRLFRRRPAAKTEGRS
jgi:TRAP-type C4-dicarboxylate transport system, small permease component